MILESASASHPGLVRPENEDALAARLPEDGGPAAAKGALFGVADGVGGSAAGEVASREALDTLVGEYYSPRAPHRVEQALRQATQAANLRVFHLAHGPQIELHGMQTTLTALVLAGAQAYLAHAGDSRAYLLRGGTLTQLTGDHSEAAELLRLRLITPQQARDHPRRSVLTRTIGSNILLRPDFSRLAVRAGDRYVLCTDGLWSELDGETLIRVAGGPPAAACEELIDLACRHGGGDNMTLQVIRVVEPDPAPEPATGGRLGRLLAGLRGG
jgi:PPM family protein phosphatase